MARKRTSTSYGRSLITDEAHHRRSIWTGGCVTDLESTIRAIVRDEIARSLNPRRLRRRPCGAGNSAPRCWGSVIHGPHGCYCREERA